MANRKYYQGKKDRMDESRGERRAREDRDAAMISADYSAPSNLPQKVKHVLYPECPYASQPELNDTIRGVDAQVAKDVFSEKRKKGSYPEKY